MNTIIALFICHFIFSITLFSMQNQSDNLSSMMPHYLALPHELQKQIVDFANCNKGADFNKTLQKNIIVKEKPLSREEYNYPFQITEQKKKIVISIFNHHTNNSEKLESLHMQENVRIAGPNLSDLVVIENRLTALGESQKPLERIKVVTKKISCVN